MNSKRIAIPLLALLSLFGSPLSASSSSPELQRLLIEMRSPDEQTSSNAITKVSRLGRKVIPLLVDELKDISVPRKGRVGMIKALQEIGPSGIRALEQSLHDFKGKPLIELIQAVGDVGPSANWAVSRLTALAKRAPTAPTKKRWGDKGGGDSRHTRSRAIVSLGKIGTEAESASSTLKRLMHTLPKNPDHWDRILRVQSAIAYLRTTERHKAVLPILLEVIRSPNECVSCRTNAAIGLGEIGPKAAEALSTMRSLRDEATDDLRPRVDKAIRDIEGDGKETRQSP